MDCSFFYGEAPSFSIVCPSSFFSLFYCMAVIYPHVQLFVLYLVISRIARDVVVVYARRLLFDFFFSPRPYSLLSSLSSTAENKTNT